VGVIGYGQFAPNFIEMFQHHPATREVRVAELDPARREEAQRRHGLRPGQVCADGFEMMAAPEVDAVAIFASRHTHFLFAKAALEAGKDVYSAPPVANSLDELQELVDLVRRTGRVYMLGETSHYYPQVVYCRRRWKAGDFGRITYLEGEYNHALNAGNGPLQEVYQKAHGAEWRQFAGMPPMYYATHSLAAVLSITGARVESVSCIGFDDQAHPDAVYGPGRNRWDNPFANQSALCQLSDGTVARINEMRRIGLSHSNDLRLKVYGEDASFEEMAGGRNPWASQHVFSYRTGGYECPDRELACVDQVDDGSQANVFRGLAAVHDPSPLPDSFRGLRNGHFGSHLFLINDFLTACITRETPVNGIDAAVRYTVPGFIAHESALRGGERMQAPAFGEDV